jgi:recombination protein RecA
MLQTISKRRWKQRSQASVSSEELGAATKVGVSPPSSCPRRNLQHPNRGPGSAANPGPHFCSTTSLEILLAKKSPVRKGPKTKAAAKPAASASSASPSPSSAQLDLVGNVIASMEKKFGRGTAFTPDADTVLCKVTDWASTLNFVIDGAIKGNNPNIPGGFPFGRLTEIAGRNGSGKTTLLGHAVAATQARGGVAAVSDTENALDLGYWEKLGVDLDTLILVQSKTIEEMFEKMEDLILTVKGFNAEVPVLIGWDSLGGTPTKAQREAKADKKFYAEAAKVVGQNLQRIVTLIAEESIALVFINHLYRDINVQYGDPWQSYGGEKVQFFATLRIRLKKGAAIKVGGTDDDDFKDTIGHMNTCQVLKNKMAPVLKTVKVPCLGNFGFYEPYVVFDQACKQGLISKNRGWNKIELDGEVINFQGWKGFQENIIPHASYEELAQAVRSQYLEI